MTSGHLGCGNVVRSPDMTPGVIDAYTAYKGVGRVTCVQRCNDLPRELSVLKKLPFFINVLTVL